MVNDLPFKQVVDRDQTEASEDEKAEHDIEPQRTDNSDRIVQCQGSQADQEEKPLDRKSVV